MKKLLALLIALQFVLPSIVSAQFTVKQGGTGVSSVSSGDLLYGTTDGLRFSKLPIGTNGSCLKTSALLPSWGTCDSNWTFFNGSGIRVSTTSNQVLIGDTATTTTSKLEVKGNGLFRMFTDTSNLGPEGYSQNTFTPSHTKWITDPGDLNFVANVPTYLATATGNGDIYQNPEDLAVPMVGGHTYRFEWTLTNVTVGDLVAEVDGDGTFGAITIANGTNHLDFVFTPATSFPPYVFVQGTTGGFKITSMSLKDASQQGNLTVQNNAIVGNSLFAVNGLNLGVPGTLGTDYYQVADSAGNLYAPARNHNYEGLFFGTPGGGSFAKFSMYSDNDTYIALRDNVNNTLIFQLNKDNQIFYGALQSGSLTFPSRFNGATGQSGFIMSGSGVQDLGLLWTGSTKTLALKNAVGSATSAWTADPGITFDSPRLTSTNSTSTNATSTNLSTSGKYTGTDPTNAWTGLVSPTHRVGLQTGTTTTWTASTTNTAYSPFVVMPFTGTLRQVRCATDASFIGVNTQVNGSDATPSYFVASTTVGKVSYTSGNTFTVGQKILMNFGTTTTSTTKSVSCTLDITETP